MFKSNFILHVFLLCLIGSGGVAQTCNCVPGEMIGLTEISHNKRLIFSNKSQLLICGYSDVNNKDTTYSEFGVYDCSAGIYISKWGATQSCKVSFTKDTLTVSALYLLPIGNDMTLEWIPFYIYDFFYTKEGLQKRTHFNKGIRKYSEIEIKSVIELYNILIINKNEIELVMSTARKLFWSYVSGSKEAGKLFIGIEAKHGPFDGAIAEE
jgi:hypothetical protein